MDFLNRHMDSRVISGDYDLYLEIRSKVDYKIDDYEYSCYRGFTEARVWQGRTVEYRDFVNSEPEFLTGVFADHLMIITNDISVVPNDNLKTLRNLLCFNDKLCDHKFIHSKKTR